MKTIKLVLVMVSLVRFSNDGWAQFRKRKATSQKTYLGISYGVARHSGHIFEDEGKAFETFEGIHWLGSISLILGRYFIQPQNTRISSNRHLRVGFETGVDLQPMRLKMLYKESPSFVIDKPLNLLSVPLLLKIGWAFSSRQPIYLSLGAGVRLNRIFDQGFATEEKQAVLANHVSIHAVFRTSPTKENFLSLQLQAGIGQHLHNFEWSLLFNYVKYADIFYKVDTFYKINGADYKRTQLSSPLNSIGIGLGGYFWF